MMFFFHLISSYIAGAFGKILIHIAKEKNSLLYRAETWILKQKDKNKLLVRDRGFIVFWETGVHVYAYV